VKIIWQAVVLAIVGSTYTLLMNGMPMECDETTPKNNSQNLRRGIYAMNALQM
jgi:hypothetical protein